MTVTDAERDEKARQRMLALRAMLVGVPGMNNGAPIGARKVPKHFSMVSK